MSITLNLRPEVEAGLLAQANKNGMTIEEYLLSIVESSVLLSALNPLTPEQHAAAFEAWSADHPHTTPLSEYAVSRESMYEGRDS